MKRRIWVLKGHCYNLITYNSVQPGHSPFFHLSSISSWKLISEPGYVTHSPVDAITSFYSLCSLKTIIWSHHCSTIQFIFLAPWPRNNQLTRLRPRPLNSSYFTACDFGNLEIEGNSSVKSLNISVITSLYSPNLKRGSWWLLLSPISCRILWLV